MSKRGMRSGQRVAMNTDRKKQAKEFWLKVATDYNGGMTPRQISERYVNPKTGRNYGMNHIYWVLKQLNIRLFQ